MNDREEMAQAVGLFEMFADAVKRWRDGEAERSRPRTRKAPDEPPEVEQPEAEPPEVEELRSRWSKAQARWWNHDSPLARKLLDKLDEWLRVLAPTWIPPIEREIDAAANPVRRALHAVEAGIADIEASEAAIPTGQRPWYFDTVELPGFDSNVNYALGPGMAMRAPCAEDDPTLPLLVCRDLLKRYLEISEARRLPNPSGRRELYERVVVTLRRAGVLAPIIGAVLRAKGYAKDETTEPQINSTIDRLKKRHGVTLPALPQGRRSKQE